MPHTYAGMIFIVTAQSVYLLYSWYVCVELCTYVSTSTKHYSLNLLILMANSVIHLSIQYLTIDLSLCMYLI